MSSTFALATDDIMLFSNSPPHYTEADRVAVSEQLEESGVARNTKKDVVEQEDGVCIGVNLRAGRHWEAPAERVWDTIASALGFLRCNEGSPDQGGHWLGVAQWYALLRRELLSVYRIHHLYDFTRRVPAGKKQPLNTAIRTELLAGSLMAIFWDADLTRRFLPTVGATDASSDYGIGAAVTTMAPLAVRALADSAARLKYVALLNGGGAPPTSAMAGKVQQRLQLEMSDFRVLFSEKIDDDRHINVREAVAEVKC